MDRLTQNAGGTYRFPYPLIAATDGLTPVMSQSPPPDVYTGTTCLLWKGTSATAITLVSELSSPPGANERVFTHLEGSFFGIILDNGDLDTLGQWGLSIDNSDVFLPAVWNSKVEDALPWEHEIDGVKARILLARVLASVANKTTDDGTKFRDPSDTYNRIEATISGRNRTVVSYTDTGI
jgi:hypothetical protein